MPTRWFLLLVIAAVLAAGVVAARGPQPAGSRRTPGLSLGPMGPVSPGSAPASGQFRFVDLTGQPAPDFTLTDMRGARYRLSRYRGKVVMLIFWATWCKTCPLELPHLSAIARALAPRGLETLSVNWEPDRGPVATMARGLDFPVLRDRDEHTRHDYDAYSVPRVVIVNRAGTIAAVIRGYQGDVIPVASALANEGFEVPASAIMERAVPVQRVPLSPGH